MLRSRSPSNTEAALAIALAFASMGAACSDDACIAGPGMVQATGLAVAAGAAAITYTNIRSGQNNDCPDPAAPMGVVSLTIQGEQTEGIDMGLVTLCIGRPDKLATGPLNLGVPDVRIIDLRGTTGGCTYAYDALQPVSGTAMAAGLCDNGANPDGYALTIDGSLTMKRTCGTTMDTLTVSFTGQTAVRHE